MGNLYLTENRLGRNEIWYIFQLCNKYNLNYILSSIVELDTTHVGYKKLVTYKSYCVTDFMKLLLKIREKSSHFLT